MITLTKTGSSALYQPQGGRQARLAFLAAAGGATIALAKCWANGGSAPVAGYFVLMDRQATSAEATKVEALLFTDPAGPKLPPQPQANGLVWLRLGDGQAPAVVAVATAALDPKDAPIMAADAIISGAPGLRVIGFGKDAPITGTAGQDGDWQSLRVQSPPVKPHDLQPASAPGKGPEIDVDLSLADAGQLSFRGLVDSFGRRAGGEVVKDLVDVVVDPVEPFHSSETYTGRRYALVEDSTGIHLRAAR